MRTVAMVINTDKPLAAKAGREIIAWLEARSIRPVLRQDSAQQVARLDLVPHEDGQWQNADLLIVLGGDGTLIRAAKDAAPYDMPILGINTGHLGFLTAVENAEMCDYLASFIEGPYKIEERLMLKASVTSGGQPAGELTALNDAVVAKGGRGKVVHLEISVSGTAVARYAADGVIISTPTGSTAYSLSAGGPIMSPNVDAFLITPICPHTLLSRPIVVGGNETITITVLESRGDCGVSADGSDPIPLAAGDRVTISRSPHVARLVRAHDYQFYDVLRQKLANSGR